MSNTAQSLLHWHDALRLAQSGMYGNHDAARWADTARGYVREDHLVEDHISIKTANPLLLRCSLCSESVMASTPQHIGRFLDVHNQCGDAPLRTWVCAGCGEHELEEHDFCRRCEGLRRQGDPGLLYRGNGQRILDRLRVYDIVLDGEDVAHVEVNSLREALRCARALFPHTPVLVHLVDGSGDDWATDHVCL